MPLAFILYNESRRPNVILWSEGLGIGGGGSALGDAGPDPKTLALIVGKS